MTDIKSKDYSWCFFGFTVIFILLGYITPAAGYSNSAGSISIFITGFGSFYIRTMGMGAGMTDNPTLLIPSTISSLIILGCLIFVIFTMYVIKKDIINYHKMKYWLLVISGGIVFSTIYWIIAMFGIIVDIEGFENTNFWGLFSPGAGLVFMFLAAGINIASVVYIGYKYDEIVEKLKDEDIERIEMEVREYVSTTQTDHLTSYSFISRYFNFQLHALKKKDVEIYLKVKLDSLKEKFKDLNNLDRNRELFIIQKVVDKYNVTFYIQNQLEKLRYINQETILRTALLSMSTQFQRLHVKEIAESTGVNNDYMIIRNIKKMIENKELHAEYFTSTSTVVFKQDQNIRDMKDLQMKNKQQELKQINSVIKE